MKNLIKIFPVVAFMAISLSSCGNKCIRCENGITSTIETECFGSNKERNEYVTSREAVGFTCNDN